MEGLYRLVNEFVRYVINEPRFRVNIKRGGDSMIKFSTRDFLEWLGSRGGFIIGNNDVHSITLRFSKYLPESSRSMGTG